MKFLLLLLISWCFDQTSTHRRASLSVTPGLSQFFEYQDVTMSCGQTGSSDWTLWRYSHSGAELSACGPGWGHPSSASTCQLTRMKPYHSGVYWCQSALSDSSVAVSITVTEGPVILDSPVLPVPRGLDVTLHCRTKETEDKQPALFYKNGVLINTAPAGHMTLRQVSKSDEDVYKCGISGEGESASSWLLVHDGVEASSLVVAPDSSQLFQYENLTLSCRADAGSTPAWTVHRFTTAASPPPRLQRCGHGWGAPTPTGCHLQTVQKFDSAIYWCESPSRQRSNSVNISVFDSGVILQIPALPVTRCDSVNLTCKSHTPGLAAAFYRDDALVGHGPAGHMTLRCVTGADEGVYRCDISGHGESPPSRLYVRGSDEDAASSELPRLLLQATRYLLVGSPYVVSTVLMVSLYHHKLPGGARPPAGTASAGSEERHEDEDPAYDDVTTEHHF